MKTILAIDDQKDNLTTIAAVIKTNLPNCEVLTALSGKEGIEIARKEQPDTILLDIIMPVMDGFEVCTKLKEDELTKHIPVIMLTAIKTDAKSRVKGLDIGADAFLAKPIDSVELSAQVNVMLRIKEAEDKLREEKLNLEELVEKKTKGLIESEFKFRNIIQQSDDGISITDEEGKLIEWNKSLEKITGIKEKDVLGKYIWDVHSQFHGETKQSQKELNKLKETLMDFLKTGTSLFCCEQLVRNYLHPDGTLKYIQGSVFPIKTDKGFMLVSLSRDVTKEKLSEEKIRQSEQQYRDLVEKGNIAISVDDIHGNLIYCNNQFLNLFGYSDEEEKKLNHELLVHPDDFKRISKYHYDRLQGIETPSRYEFKGVKNDGSIIHIEIDVSEVIENDGKLSRTRTYMWDVTKRKQAEDALQKSEEKYRTIFESTGTATMIVDDDTTILQVNKECEKATGFLNSELVGTSWIKYVDKSDLELMLTRQQQRSVVPDSVPNKYDVKLIDAKGRIRNTILNIGNIPDTNMTVVSMLDITEAKLNENKLFESEELYRTLVESSLQGVVIAQSNPLRLSFANSSMKKITGYEVSELTSMNPAQLVELIHKDHREHFFQTFQNRLEGKEKKQNQEYMIVSKTGEEKWVQTYSNLIDFKGEKATLTTYSDITEQKKAVEEIKRMAQMLDIAPNSVTVHDLDGNFLYANQKTYDIHGYTKEEFLALLLGKLDTAETAKLIPGRIKKIIEEGQANFEVEHYKKNGDVIPMEVFAVNTKWGDTDAIISVATDITERKQNAELILAQNIQYSNLLKNLNGMVYHCENDKNWTMRFISEGCYDLTAYKPEELIDNKKLAFNDLILPEYREFLWNHWQENLTINHEVEVEYEIKCADGQIKWVWERGRGVFNEDDKLLHLEGFITDITDRKKAQKALSESEQKYRLLATNTLDSIWTTDREFNMTYVNSAITKFLGYTPDEFIGLNPATYTTEEGMRVIQEEAMLLIEKFKNGEIVQSTFEIQQKRKDGKIIDVEITSNLLLDNSGLFIGFQGRSIDITDYKRSEQIKKVLFNISNAVIITKNLEELISLVYNELGTIIDTTNFYIALYDNQNDTISLPFIVDEKDKPNSFPAGKTLTKYVIKTKKPLLVKKEQIIKLEESGDVESFGADAEIWLGVPLKIKGKVTGVLTVQSYTDENAYNSSDVEMLEFVSEQISISIERKKAEEDLLIALKKATESERLKSAFLTNMSHEIRTPMNGILGFTNLLKEPGLSGEEQQEYIEIIERSGDRMLNTINDIMDISMIESDQVKTSIKNVNINEETNTLFSFFKPEVEEKGMSFKLNNSLDDEKATIKTDKEKVYAILTNLIKNSIKYSKKGSIEFGYNLIPDKLFPTIEFYVKDTGIGIPKDRQKAVFDRFVQADIEDKEVYEGSGLGLAISKAYVEMLGGEMWVESEVGVGTTFYFTLPYHMDKKVENENDNEKHQIYQETQDKKLKILIAEDEEFADLHLSILLKNTAKEILHAKNGLEVIEIFQKNPGIDLILMDIKMPKMGGHEATKQIRKFNKDVIIIAQTAYALEGDYEKAIEAGCDDYISKPINKDELMEKIGKLLNS